MSVGDERVRDDLDIVHGLNEQEITGGCDGDLGVGVVEDVDGHKRLHGLRPRCRCPAAHHWPQATSMPHCVDS
jgi:hypothetical protein